MSENQCTYMPDTHEVLDVFFEQGVTHVNAPDEADSVFACEEFAYEPWPCW